MKRLIAAAAIVGASIALALPASADPSACIGQVTVAVAGTTVVDERDICVPPAE